MVSGFELCMKLIVNLQTVIENGFKEQKEKFKAFEAFVDEKDDINTEFMRKLSDHQDKQLQKHLNLQTEYLSRMIALGPKPKL